MERGVSESMKTFFMLVKSFSFVFSALIAIPFYKSYFLLDCTTLTRLFTIGFLFSLEREATREVVGLFTEVEEAFLVRVPLMRCSGNSCLSRDLGLKTAVWPPTRRFGTDVVCLRTTGAALG